MSPRTKVTPRRIWHAIGSFLDRERPRGAFLLALLVVCSVFAIIRVPSCELRNRVDLPPQGRFQAEDEARRTVVQVIGALALVLTLWATFKRTKAAEETARASSETVRATIDGQINDRYIKAIELLGREELQLRLGGIYALERIARDSGRDHWTVVEVLLAFVRANAPASDCHTARYSANEPASPPRPDVQAVLTVIGRRSTNQDGAGILDLSKTDLRGADFRGLDFQRARFYGACLQSANFTGADVRVADFSAASVRGTVFTDARLDGANLITALTGGTYCQGASLRGTRVSEDNIKGLDALSDDQRRGLVVAHWRQWDSPGSFVVGPQPGPE
jgi:hypothetical protein